jgi:hypothetical protein
MLIAIGDLSGARLNQSFLTCIACSSKERICSTVRWTYQLGVVIQHQLLFNPVAACLSPVCRTSGSCSGLTSNRWVGLHVRLFSMSHPLIPSCWYLCRGTHTSHSLCMGHERMETRQHVTWLRLCTCRPG